MSDFIDDGGHESEWTLKFTRERMHVFGEEKPRKKYMYMVTGHKDFPEGTASTLLSGWSNESWEKAFSHFLKQITMAAESGCGYEKTYPPTKKYTFEDILKLKSISPQEYDANMEGYDKGCKVGHNWSIDPADIPYFAKLLINKDCIPQDKLGNTLKTYKSKVIYKIIGERMGFYKGNSEYNDSPVKRGEKPVRLAWVDDVNAIMNAFNIPFIPRKANE